MFEVSVTGRFAATHQLRLADGRPEAPHRHDWRVVVTLAGPELDDLGILLDFTLIKRQLEELLATLHECNLNELPAFARANPSAENIAAHLAQQLGESLPANVRLACVEVEEAPECVARYRPTGATPRQQGNNVTK